MKAQITGNGFSIGLHAVLLALFWSLSGQMPTAKPPLPLDLHVMQGAAEPAREEANPGPPAAAAPAPLPEVQESQPEPEVQPVVPVALKPVARKKSVTPKIVPQQERPQEQQTPARQEPAPLPRPLSRRLQPGPVRPKQRQLLPIQKNRAIPLPAALARVAGCTVPER